MLKALREINATRPLKETCSCGLDGTHAQQEELIPCFLCNAKLHAECAQWEPFLGRMPAGVFLCPRCLRGRRPCIEDVEAAVEIAPKNCLERLLVDNLLKLSHSAFGRLQHAIQGISNDLNEVSGEQKAL